MIIAAIVLLVVLALMGAPLFAIILGAAALGFYTLEIELAVLHLDIYRSYSVVLMALPLFTFAGFLLSESKPPTACCGSTRPRWLDARWHGLCCADCLCVFTA